MSAKYSQQYKKQLTIRVEACSVTEQIEIFKIVEKNTCLFTQNKNGIFINLVNTNDSVIEQIVDYVTFSLQNKTDFAEHDRKINECKLSSTVPPPNETCLKSILSGGCDDDWEKLVHESKSNERVQKFVHMLNNTSRDSHEGAQKRLPSLFSNACKRFARRAISTKKIEHDLINELSKEDYSD